MVTRQLFSSVSSDNCGFTEVVIIVPRGPLTSTLTTSDYVQPIRCVYAAVFLQTRIEVKR